MSRWTTPRLWVAPSAPAIWTAMAAASRDSSGLISPSHSFRVPPGAVLGLAPVVDTFTAIEPHLRVEFGATEEIAFPSTTCATGVGFYPVYSDKPFGVF